MPGITVGIDGSENSRALDWAMKEAAARRYSLTVLTVHEVVASFWTGDPATTPQISSSRRSKTLSTSARLAIPTSRPSRQPLDAPGLHEPGGAPDGRVGLNGYGGPGHQLPGGRAGRLGLLLQAPLQADQSRRQVLVGLLEQQGPPPIPPRSPGPRRRSPGRHSPGTAAALRQSPCSQRLSGAPRPGRSSTSLTVVVMRIPPSGFQAQPSTATAHRAARAPSGTISGAPRRPGRARAAAVPD
jgi:Universal stress protein family